MEYKKWFIDSEAIARDYAISFGVLGAVFVALLLCLVFSRIWERLKLRSVVLLFGMLCAASAWADSVDISTTSNWTVPADVTEVEIEIWGKGGAGGGYYFYSGAGGGGGGYSKVTIGVTPGDAINVTNNAMNYTSTQKNGGSVNCRAYWGSAGVTTTPGAGGSNASAIGDVKTSGGTGGERSGSTPGAGGSCPNSGPGVGGVGAVSGGSPGTGGPWLVRITWTEPAGVEPPTFSLADGTYDHGQSTTITVGDGGNAVHYTTDGSTPTSASPVASGTISLAANGSYTFKAISRNTTTEEVSTVAVGTWEIETPAPAPPTISPSTAAQSGEFLLTIEPGDGNSIVYATYDGSDPGPPGGDPWEAPQGTIVSGGYGYVSPPITVRAIALSMDGLVYSSVTTMSFTQTPGPNTVATPVFSPASQTFELELDVTCTCATSGAVIRWTDNGTTPTSASPVWNPQTIVSTTTFKAKAWKTGLNPSGVGSATYQLVLSGSGGDPCDDAESDGSTPVRRCPDSDGDGIPDIVEEIWQNLQGNNGLLDPAVAGDETIDTDGDGTPDFWELRYLFTCQCGPGNHGNTVQDPTQSSPTQTINCQPCLCTESEYLGSNPTGTEAYVASITMAQLLAASSADRDADNDGEFDECTNNPSDGNGNGHCCNCCCSACKAASAAQWNAIQQEDPETDSDGDGCPDFQDPAPDDPYIACPENPDYDNKLTGMQSVLVMPSSGIGPSLPQTQYTLTFPLTIPGMGSQNFYLKVLPDTSTQLGYALETLRQLARGLGVVLAAWFFAHKVVRAWQTY